MTALAIPFNCEVLAWSETTLSENALGLDVVQKSVDEATNNRGRRACGAGVGGRIFPTPDPVGCEAFSVQMLDITIADDVAKHLSRQYGPSTDLVLYPGLSTGLVFPK